MGIIETILLGTAGSAVWDANKATAEAAIQYLRSKKPETVQAIEGAFAAGKDDEARSALAGILEVMAADGEVAISGAFITAIKGATFDHQHGRIEIGGTTISAPSLVTGGGPGSTGETIIGGDTELKGAGTRIQVGKGARIRMVGGARIRQN